MPTKIKEVEVEVMPAQGPPSREQEFTRILASILDDLIPIARCEALHGLFDGAAGVALAS